MTSNRQKNKSIRLGRTAERPYWVVFLSIIIRAVHQVGAAVFLACFLIDGVEKVPVFYITLASVSGLILLFTEGLRHRQIFLEVSGVYTLLKIVILGLAFHGALPMLPSALIVFILASFFSHAPKSIRHRLLF